MLRHLWRALRGKQNRSTVAALRPWLGLEMCEPRLLLDGAPFSYDAFNPLGGKPVIVAGPGGIGSDPLIDLDGNGIGDLIVQYDARAHLAAVQSLNISAILVNPDGTSRENKIAQYETRVDIAQILTADLNSDGHLDVVVLHDNGNTSSKHRQLDIYLGQEDGYFTHPNETMDLGTTPGFPTMTLLDMNGDGKIDIHMREGAKFTVYRGNNNGTFAAPVVSTFNNLVLSGIINLSFADDLSGDSIPDLVVSGISAAGVPALLVVKGLSTGAYDTASPLFSDTTHSLTFLDLAQLSNDNKLDIIAYGNIPLQGDSAASIFVLRNTGSGGYTESFHSPTYSGGTLHQLLSGEPLQPNFVTDLDGDGDRDLITLEGSLLNTNVIFHIARNDGNAGFTEIQSFTATDFPVSSTTIEVADIDGDARPDIFVPQFISQSGQRATLYFNNGSGSFVTPGQLLVPTLTSSAYPRIADFTGDGKLDVIFQGVSNIGAAAQIFVNDQTGRAFTAGPHSLVGRIHLSVSGGSLADPLLDFTGDGRPDLIDYTSAGAGTAGGIGILTSDANGVLTLLTPSVNLAANLQQTDVPLLGDFNHDSKPDLMFAAATGSTFDIAGLNILINGVSAPTDTAGDNIATARDLGPLTTNLTLNEYVDAAVGSDVRDRQDFYKFTLTTAHLVRASTIPSVGAVSVFIRNAQGAIVAGSTVGAFTPASAQATLNPGTYYVSVAKSGTANTTYRLDIELPDDSTPLAVFADVTEIISGQQTAISFGDVALTTTDTRRTFLVRNKGTVPVDLGAVTLPAGYSFAGDTLGVTLAPGASDTFKVSLNTSAVGTFAGDIVIPATTPSSSFVIPITGSVSSPVAVEVPLIRVKYFAAPTVITSGQSTPVSLGTHAQNSGAAQIILEVHNDGLAPLTLSAPQFTGPFSAVAGNLLSLSIAPGQSDSFTIELDDATIGTFQGTVSIAHNSGGTDGTFTFPLAGTITEAEPEPQPDLSGSITSVLLGGKAFAAGDKLIPGDKITAQLQITNAGDAEFNVQNVNIAFFLSADEARDGSDIPLATVLVKKLQLDATDHLDIAAALQIPTDLPSGNYFLLADLDSTTVVTEGDETNNTARTAAALPVTLAAGEVGTRNVVLTVADDDGTQATFKLAGGGNAEVIRGDGFFDLILSGVNAKSALTITTKDSGLVNDDGKIVLRNVTIGSAGLNLAAPAAFAALETTGADPLGKLLAKTARLIGTLEAPGGLTNLTLDETDTGAVIHIGTPPPEVKNPTVTLAFNLMRNTSIASEVPIKSLTATQWLHDEGSVSAAAAPSVGSIAIKGNKKVGLAGDFEASLTLSGVGATTTTLGSAKIAGNLERSTWDITGNVGAVTAADSDQWNLALHSTLKSLTLKNVTNANLVINGDAPALKFNSFSGNLTAQNIKSLAVAANASGAITAHTVGTFAVKGNVTDMQITLDQSTVGNAKAVALKAATIGGTATNLTLHSAGNLGAISAGRLVNSSIFAGLALNATALPTTVDQLVDRTATLASLTVKGIKGSPDAALVASNIAAGQIKSAKIASISTTAAGTPFGLAADLIAPLTLTVDGTVIKLPALDAPNPQTEQVQNNLIVRALEVMFDHAGIFL